MDIEEERKAFDIYEEEQLKKDQWWMYGFDAFEVWLAAKVHAAEMAKPVRIASDYTDQWFAFQPSWKGPVFASESDAIQWAKDNGYRVIE